MASAQHGIAMLPYISRIFKSKSGGDESEGGLQAILYVQAKLEELAPGKKTQEPALRKRGRSTRAILHVQVKLEVWRRAPNTSGEDRQVQKWHLRVLLGHEQWMEEVQVHKANQGHGKERD